MAMKCFLTELFKRNLLGGLNLNRYLLMYAHFKRSMLQKQNLPFFPVKNYKRNFVKYSRPRSTCGGDALRREKDNFILMRHICR